MSWRIRSEELERIQEICTYHTYNNVGSRKLVRSSTNRVTNYYVIDVDSMLVTINSTKSASLIGFSWGSRTVLCYFFFDLLEQKGASPSSKVYKQ